MSSPAKLARPGIGVSGMQNNTDDEFADVLPRQVTIIEPDVLAEMHHLRIPSEIRDEVLGCVAQLPERVAWFGRFFPAPEPAFREGLSLFCYNFFPATGGPSARPATSFRIPPR